MIDFKTNQKAIVNNSMIDTFYQVKKVLGVESPKGILTAIEKCNEWLGMFHSEDLKELDELMPEISKYLFVDVLECLKAFEGLNELYDLLSEKTTEPINDAMKKFVKVAVRANVKRAMLVNNILYTKHSKEYRVLCGYSNHLDIVPRAVSDDSKNEPHEAK